MRAHRSHPNRTSVTRTHANSARAQKPNYREGQGDREAIMSATAAWVLPEKYTEDLEDETGEVMSKR